MASIRQGFAWMTMSQGSLFVLQFVVSILIARLLGPYEMGIFAIALSIVGLLSIIRSFGLGSYFIRAVEVTEPLRRTLFTINGILAVAVSLAILVLSLLGGALLKEPGVEDLLRVMAILPLVGIFDFIPATSIERRGDFRLVAIINILRYSLANAATLAFASAGHGYMSLAYGQLIMAVVAAVLNNLFARDTIVFSPSLRDWRDVVRFGTQMLAISAINGLQGRMADLVLAKFLGLAAFGIYSRATSLTGVLWENIQIIVLRVLFVDFAEQKRQGISLRHSYLRLTQVLTGFLWPVFVGIGVVSGPLVLALFGEKWLDAIMPLGILSLSAALFVPIMVAYDIFVISNETARQTRLEMLRAPASLALFTLGCLVSLEAAAATKVVEAVIMYLVYRPHLERMTDTRWADYVPIYGRSLLLVVAAVLPAAVVMQFYGWSPLAPLPVVLAGVAAGGLAWAALLWALRHPLFEEGARLLSKLRRPGAEGAAPQA
ncbi:oligosaccharide flippase family protein [Muricoccus aerilatus]|uniref:oligosaccharide flippase family protein n=1 Tax=Muricoccus aerilatus TaxID=452982 RepID=UPI0024816B1A|nr:oligosaccharide flippase family protein [Roseomonas aerilata]